MTGMSLPPGARELLETTAVAHVVTLNEDGSPQVTAAWVGLEGDEIVLATLPDQRKLRNLRRDPRVALSVESSNVNAWGLREYLVVYGRACCVQASIGRPGSDAADPLGRDPGDEPV
jgi:PPOX class probable F420-dependent enzyme